MANCPSSRTRGASKTSEVMARVKMEGVSVPKRVGKPAEAVVPPSTIQEVQEVDSSSEDEVVVKKTPAKRVEEHVEHNAAKKRKLVDELPLTSFDDIPLTDGDRLLKSYAEEYRKGVDLSQLTVQLVSSISKSLQCALAVGHGYKAAEASHSRVAVDREKAKEEIEFLNTERNTCQKKLEALSSDIKVSQAQVRDLELRLENRDAEVERLEGALVKLNDQIKDVQQELDSMKGTQQVDAIFSNLCGRIGILAEPSSSHDLKAELLKFKRIFPDDPTFDDLIKEIGVVIPEIEQSATECEGEVEAGASEKEGDGSKTPST